jgi:hypothetical protein
LRTSRGSSTCIRPSLFCLPPLGCTTCMGLEALSLCLVEMTGFPCLNFSGRSSSPEASSLDCERFP